MSHAVHCPHRNHGLPRISRLGWLMGLYGENFDRIERLLDSRRLGPGSYRSIGHDGLPLDVDVLAVHAYMSELRLSYALIDPVSRSEEHTSELQSRLHLVCRLLLEKKKKKT